jgi:hypothetical protein
MRGKGSGRGKGAAAQHRCVAVQVAFESKGLKSGDRMHFSFQGLKPVAFKRSCSTAFNVYVYRVH